jgi:uncharacterized protein YbbC (DUF1343 family)
MKRLLSIVALLVAIAEVSAGQQPAVRCGSEVLLGSDLSLLRGKGVALVTNHTGRLPNGTYLVDTLRARGIRIVALFGPEHGIRGDAAPGATVGDSVDSRTGVRIYSLYGSVNKPTPVMLKDVDLIVYDIQDVGARFYTYISTMFLAMEAAAEQHIPFVVLDRPNPLGGISIAGPVIQDSLRSFVGKFRVPIVYGCTCGELAQMINGEGWLKDGIRADLRVIPIEGWKREMLWPATGLEWTPPSPNLRTVEATLAYPGTCLIEGTNVSEGRGSSTPFLTFGAPFIDEQKLWSAITGRALPGVRFAPVRFTPQTSKFTGVECRGISIVITDPATFDPVLTGLCIVQNILQLHPTEARVNTRRFNRLMGVPGVPERLKDGMPPSELVESWKSELDEFSRISGKYHIYK